MKYETHCINKVECTLVNEKDVLDFERDFKIDAAYSLQAASLTDLYFWRECTMFQYDEKEFFSSLH